MTSFDPGWVTTSSFLFGTSITLPFAPEGDPGPNGHYVWWIILDHASVTITSAEQLNGTTPVDTLDVVRTVHYSDASFYVLSGAKHASTTTLRVTFSSAPSAQYAYYAGDFPTGTDNIAADETLSGLGPEIVGSTGVSPYAAAVIKATNAGAAPTLVPQTSGPYDDISFTSTTNLAMRVTAYEPDSPNPSFEVESEDGSLLHFHALAGGSAAVARWWVGVVGWGAGGSVCFTAEHAGQTGGGDSTTIIRWDNAVEGCGITDPGGTFWTQVFLPAGTYTITFTGTGMFGNPITPQINDDGGATPITSGVPFEYVSTGENISIIDQTGAAYETASLSICC